MEKDYSYILYNNDTRVFVYKGDKTLKSFGSVPKKIIQEIAAKLGLYLYGEISYYTSKQVFKAGLLCNDSGGVVNLFTTASRAKFNRFVCEHNKILNDYIKIA